VHNPATYRRRGRVECSARERKGAGERQVSKRKMGMPKMHEDADEDAGYEEQVRLSQSV
jgi:hypothetical protein